MKKLYLNQRLTHFFEWLRVLLFIIHNRGRNSYGANGLKRIVQRYLLEYSTSSEQLKEAEIALREIENLLQLTRINGLKRFGARNDGGYIGIEPKGKLIVLSGGGGKNIDFEIGLAENGSRIHVYDPTINRLPREHENVTHVKYALAGPGDKTFKSSVRLSDAYLALYSDSFDSAWLKLDIEGSEIKLLAEDLALLSKFQQIFVEFHDTYQVVDPIFRNHFINILETLKESHYVIAMVSNNWQGFTNFGNAFLPVTFEVTFLSKQFAVEISEDTDYRSLKAANNPKRPEIPDLPFHI